MLYNKTHFTSNKCSYFPKVLTSTTFKDSLTMDKDNENSSM